MITVLIMFFFLRPAVSFFRPRNQSVSKRTKNQHHPTTISPAALRNNSMQSYLKSAYRTNSSILQIYFQPHSQSFIFCESLHRSKDFREVHFYFEIIREIQNIYAPFQFNLRNLFILSDFCFEIVKIDLFFLLAFRWDMQSQVRTLAGSTPGNILGK